MTLLADAAVDLANVPLLAGLAAFGFAVGVLTGLFGVGGGFLIVPGLNLLFGIAWPAAIGSSLAFIVGTGAAGTARHMRMRNVEPRATLILGGAAVVGAVLGALALDRLEAGFGEANVGKFNTLMQGIFVGLLLLTAALVFRRAGETRSRPPVLQRLPLGPRVDLPHVGLAGVSLPGLLATGLAVGALSGLLGIGGGVLLVPLLILVVGLTPHQAVGTSLGIVLLASISGTIKHGLAGNVDLVLAMALLVGSTLGVQVGAFFCARLHAKRLREYFAVIVFLAAVALAADLARKLLP